MHIEHRKAFWISFSVAFILVAGVGFTVFRTTPPNIASGETSARTSGATNPANQLANGNQNDDQRFSQPNANSPSAGQKPPTDTASQVSLVGIKRTSAIASFKTAGSVWAMAYDEPTSLLYLSHDAKGFVGYDIQLRKQRQLEPSATLAVAGLPTAIEVGTHKYRRQIFTAGDGEPVIKVFDADTHKATRKILLNEGTIVDLISASNNPSDPYLYYSGTEAIQEPSEAWSESEQKWHERKLIVSGRRKRPVNVVGRINLHNSQIDVCLLTDRMIELEPAHKGDKLYYSQGGGLGIGEFQREDGKLVFRRKTYTQIAAVDEKSPSPRVVLQPASSSVLNGNRHTNKWMNFTIGTYRPPAQSAAIARESRTSGHDIATVLAAFQQCPYCFGICPLKNTAFFASTNGQSFRTEIPLPIAIGSKGSKKPGSSKNNPRWREGTAVNTSARFLDASVDEAAKLGLLVLDGSVHICEMAESGLEAFHQISTLLPSTVQLGQDLKLPLDVSPPEAVVRFVEPRKTTGRYGFSPLRKKENFHIAHLDASVLPQVKHLYVKSLAPFTNLILPCEIKIGDERMQVVDMNEFQTALIVRRTNPVGHSVDTPIEIFPNGTDNSSSVPEVINNVVTWSPDETQVGKQLILLAVSTKSTRSIVSWYVEVTEAKQRPDNFDLPLYVKGVVSTQNELYLWGTAKDDSERNILTLVDKDTLKVIQNIDVPHPIRTLTLGSEAAYFSFHGSSSIGTVHRELDQELQLHDVGMVPVELVTVADRYLIGRSGAQDPSGKPDLQLQLPSLEPSDSIEALHFPRPAGQGWLWNLQVRNESLDKIELLHAPWPYRWMQDFDAPWSLYKRDSGISLATQGLAGTIRFTRVAASYYADLGWPINYSRSATGNKVKPKRTVPYPSGVKFDRSSKHTTALCNDRILLVSNGKLVPIPLSKFGIHGQRNVFAFDNRQSVLTLKQDRATDVQYHAEGAIEYRLALYDTNPELREKPFETHMSGDGSFRCQLKSDTMARPLPEASVFDKFFPPELDTKDAKYVYAVATAVNRDGTLAVMRHVYLVK